MTLVVADIHDGHLVLVADTMITFAGNDAKTRHAYETGLPKLVILSPDLCAGYAGNDPEGNLRALVGLRGASFDEVVEAAAKITHASFIVATTSPRPTITRVRDGEDEDLTDLGRAWIGDIDGYEIFQTFRTPPSDKVDHARAIRSAMQRVVAWPDGPTVGGHDLMVTHRPDGFTFVPEPRITGPERAEIHWMSDGAGGRRPEMRVPPGEDDTFQVIGAVVGTGTTPNAVGFWHATNGLGIVYPHEHPWEPIVTHTTTIEALVEHGASHGQQLVAPPMPTPTLAEFNAMLNTPGTLYRVVPHP